MCSDTERWEILIVLHIRSFLMSHERSGMIPGDSGTTVWFSTGRCIVTSLIKCDFYLHYSFDGLQIRFNFQPLNMH